MDAVALNRSKGIGNGNQCVDIPAGSGGPGKHKTGLCRAKVKY